MTAPLLNYKLLKKAVIILLIMFLLLIPGLVSGQDNDEVEIPEIEIQITEEDNGFFDTASTFFWILVGLLLIIILLLVFLVGRSRGGR